MLSLRQPHASQHAESARNPPGLRLPGIEYRTGPLMGASACETNRV